MARKRTPRGRNAPKLSMPRVSADEHKWVTEQAAAAKVSLAQWVRDRLLAGMPIRYRDPAAVSPEEFARYAAGTTIARPPRLVGSQPADGRKHAMDCAAYDGKACDCPLRLPPFVPYDPTIRKGG